MSSLAHNLPSPSFQVLYYYGSPFIIIIVVVGGGGVVVDISAIGVSSGMGMDIAVRDAS